MTPWAGQLQGRNCLLHGLCRMKPPTRAADRPIAELIPRRSSGDGSIVPELRDAAGTVGAVLALLCVLPVIAVFAGNAALSRHLQQIAPMTAGLAIQATTELNTLPISPRAGLGVLAAWAAGWLVLGGLLLDRRDA